MHKLELPFTNTGDCIDALGKLCTLTVSSTVSEGHNTLVVPVTVIVYTPAAGHVRRYGPPLFEFAAITDALPKSHT